MWHGKQAPLFWVQNSYASLHQHYSNPPPTGWLFIQENENKCHKSVAELIFYCIDETRKPYHKGSGSDTKRNSGWGQIEKKGGGKRGERGREWDGPSAKTLNTSSSVAESVNILDLASERLVAAFFHDNCRAMSFALTAQHTQTFTQSRTYSQSESSSVANLWTHRQLECRLQ